MGAAAVFGDYAAQHHMVSGACSGGYSQEYLDYACSGYSGFGFSGDYGGGYMYIAKFYMQETYGQELERGYCSGSPALFCGVGILLCGSDKHTGYYGPVHCALCGVHTVFAGQEKCRCTGDGGRFYDMSYVLWDCELCGKMSKVLPVYEVGDFKRRYKCDMQKRGNYDKKRR